MNPPRRKDRILRLNIIKLVGKSKGMTLTEIANKTKRTRYKISKEVYNLIGLGKLETIKVGNYEIVRIK